MTSLDINHLKRVASGQWGSILCDTLGFGPELLDGRGHPCPDCGGTDRFSAMNDFNDTGAVYCRKCDGPGGDGFATLQHYGDMTFADAIQLVARHLGVCDTEPAQPADLVTLICREKRMPMDAFRKFKPTLDKRGREKTPVVRVPVYNESGEPFSYFDLLPGEKGKFKHGKGNAGLFFPGRIPKSGESWLLVEGVKDASALVELGFNASGLNTSALNSKYARLFADCDVTIVPDLDQAGIGGADKSASRLVGIVKSVRIARLPGEVKPTKGDDVRDCLHRPDGERLVRESIDSATTWEPNPQSADGRPIVVITPNEAIVTKEVLEHLGNLGWDKPWDCKDDVRLYQRDGKLVHVVCEPIPESTGITVPPATPRIVQIPKAILRERIGQACELVTEKTVNGETQIVHTKPPSWLIAAIYERGQYPATIRPLTALTFAPSMRSDGSLIQEPGYDSLMRLLYLPSEHFPLVADRPTQADAKTAADLLLDVVYDFPFVDGSHRTSWVSLVVTMIARPAINGTCPLFAIDANTRGSGKSKLADLASIIAYGRTAARKTWPPCDEECRKTITSIVSAAYPCCLFDNVDSELGGASLDALLTSTAWRDRKLGTNDMIEMAAPQVWIATGNNLVLGADTARRTQYCRLESPLENPEDRQGFRHSDIIAYVQGNRALLATSALAIVRAYLVSGDSAAVDQWGSFEAWNDTVRAALVWCGVDDPRNTKQVVREADRSAEVLTLIHQAFDEIDPQRGGMTSGDLTKLYFKRQGAGDDAPYVYPILRQAISELITGRIGSQQIGNALRKYKGRVRNGKILEQATTRGRPWTLSERTPVTPGAPVSNLKKNNLEVLSIRKLEENTTNESLDEGQSGAPGAPGVRLPNRLERVRKTI